jgi:hypothetical protein
MHFRAATGGRSLTHAQYLTALVELHRRARQGAEDWHGAEHHSTPSASRRKAKTNASSRQRS